MNTSLISALSLQKRYFRRMVLHCLTSRNFQPMVAHYAFMGGIQRTRGFLLRGARSKCAIEKSKLDSPTCNTTPCLGNRSRRPNGNYSSFLSRPSGRANLLPDTAHQEREIPC